MELVNPMAEETKERAKWEMLPSQWTIGGLQPGNPYRKGNDFGKAGAEYPMMLYRAQQVPGSGKWATAMPVPRFFGDRSGDDWRVACEQAEQFTRDCQKTVHSPEEHKAALESGEGWRESPKEAVEHALALEKAVSDAAANRAWQDRNMSDKAKAESARHEEANFGHQAEIPEQRIVRRVKKNTKKAPANAA